MNKEVINVEDNDAEEDEDLKRAIALSLEQNVTGSNEHTMDISDETAATSLAQLSTVSQQEAQTPILLDEEPIEDPSYQFRVEKYVGLLNVGNTCYFNSLLQTYFLSPILKYAIFRDCKKLEQRQQNSLPTLPQSVELVEEVQRIFCYMQLSVYKWITPASILQRLFDKDGNTVSIGQQEDITEFNELLLQRLEEGLHCIANYKEECSPEDYYKHIEQPIIKSIFYGKSVECFSAREEDGSPIEMFKEDIFKNLIVYATPTTRTLYDCLENATDTLVDYTTDKGFKTTAWKTLWFKDAPPILVFQINRATYNPETKKFQKLKIPLHFEKELYLDRFFEQNRELTIPIRDQVKQWKQQLQCTQNELQQICSYKQSSMNLRDSFSVTLDFLHEQHEQAELDHITTPHPFHIDVGKKPTAPQQLATALRVISNYYHCYDQQLNQLSKLEKLLQLNISTAFDKYERRNQMYTLTSIIMHSGPTLESGHYWAYIFDEGKWFKFNDTEVKQMCEAEVMLEAIGSEQSSTSAYCLFYTDLTKCAGYPLQNILGSIPDRFQQEVLISNEKLHTQITKYKETMNNINLAKLKRLYKEKWEEAEQTNKTNTGTKDYRTKQFTSYLLAIKETMWCQGAILHEAYLHVLCKGIHMDQNSDIFNLLKNEYGEEPVENAVRIAQFEILSEEEIGRKCQEYNWIEKLDMFKTEYNNLRKREMFIGYSAHYLSKLNYSEALKYAVSAMEIQKTIAHNAEFPLPIDANMCFEISVIRCCVIVNNVLINKQYVDGLQWMKYTLSAVLEFASPIFQNCFNIFQKQWIAHFGQQEKLSKEISDLIDEYFALKERSQKGEKVWSVGFSFAKNPPPYHFHDRSVNMSKLQQFIEELSQWKQSLSNTISRNVFSQ